MRMTLFRFVDPKDAGFSRALDKFFGGVQDERSLLLLHASQRDA